MAKWRHGLDCAVCKVDSLKAVYTQTQSGHNRIVGYGYCLTCNKIYALQQESIWGEKRC
jgi:hypothetical protein